MFIIQATEENDLLSPMSDDDAQWYMGAEIFRPCCKKWQEILSREMSLNSKKVLKGCLEKFAATNSCEKL